jgi:flagellar hook-associated protein 2
MSSITSAGVASGIDFESIIKASVEAKKQQMNSKLTTNKQNSKLELTGVGLLKSNLSTFKDLCDKIGKENSFNKRSVTIKQDATNPVFKCEAKDDASNGSYNIAVTHLAQSTSFSTSVADSTAKLGAGTLTFGIGSGEDSKTFSIEVGEDDTLETLRNKINSSADNFGVTANILTLADGTSKFVLDSGNTGDKYRNFRIGAEGSANLEQFEARISKDGNGNLVARGNMSLVQLGQDAKITVDGAELSSDTNVFDDKIKGLKLTVNRLSDTEEITNADGSVIQGFKSNNVKIDTDTQGIKSLLQDFVDTYNSLRSSLDALSARDTYTDGKCNNDGGYLAGDSTCSAIKSSLTNLISSFKIDTADTNNIFTMGIEMDNDGNLSIDSTKFNEIVDKNYEQLVNAFGGKDGLCSKIETYLKDYTKSSGVLSQRTDAVNSEIKQWNNKESANDFYLQKYEASLRSRYAGLDAYIANMNTSLSYLMSALPANSGQSA